MGTEGGEEGTVRGGGRGGGDCEGDSKIQRIALEALYSGEWLPHCPPAGGVGQAHVHSDI